MTVAESYMATYLPGITAEYDYTLSITPHEGMPVEGGKHQTIFELDDKSLVVVPIGDASAFDISLKWTLITEADAGTILSLYHDVNKCNGSEKSFYWSHPTETSNTYVVRFIEPPTFEWVAGYVGYMSVAIRVRVEGVKP